MERTSSSSGDLSLLIERLGLSDDEVLRVFGLAPLDAIAGDVGHRPEVAILVALTGEAVEAVGETALRRWVRMSLPGGGTPLDLLDAQRFGEFEDAVHQLIRRGFMVRNV